LTIAERFDAAGTLGGVLQFFQNIVSFVTRR
jgi:hypothetical protein